MDLFAMYPERVVKNKQHHITDQEAMVLYIGVTFAVQSQVDVAL